MKNKKSVIPPAPIVCKLNNNPEKQRTHALLFSLVDLLALKKEVTVTDYFTYLNCFSYEQFKRFTTRISDKRNKELLVNQEYFILFYAILHLIPILFRNKEVLMLLKEPLSEDNLENFDKTNEEIISFCNKALDELRKNLKKNNALIIAINKIDGYSVSG